MATKNYMTAIKVTISFLVFFAVIFGLGAWLYIRQFQNLPQSTKNINQHQKEDKNTENELNILIPTNETVIADSPVVISGKTYPESIIAIISTTDDELISSDKSGNFRFELEPKEGLNITFITAAQKDKGKIIAETLSFYTSQEETPGTRIFAGTIKGTLDENLTVSGVSETKTVQISEATLVEEQEQVATGSAQESLRVGDFIIAFGSVDNFGIFKATKVKIEPKAPNIITEAVFGTVNERDEEELELDLIGDGSKKFITSEVTSVIVKGDVELDLDEIQSGDFIAAILKQSGLKIEAIKILLIPSEREKEASPSST